MLTVLVLSPLRAFGSSGNFRYSLVVASAFSIGTQVDLISQHLSLEHFNPIEGCSVDVELVFQVIETRVGADETPAVMATDPSGLVPPALVCR